jgi:hypothetical protein
MKLTITNPQGVTTTYDFIDDLTAQAFAVNAKAEGCEVLMECEE